MAKGSTPVTQTTSTQLPPEAQELMNLALPQLRQFGTSPPKLPDFSTVAPFDPSQMAGQEMALSTAAGPQTDIVSGAGTAQQRLTSGELLTPESNPALAATINASTRPIINDLLEKALPAIRSGAYTTGNFGSSRQGIAEGLATGRAAQAVGDTAAKVATEGYGRGLDAMTKGVALAPQTAQTQLLPAVTTSGVGDVRQGMAQALLGEQASRFNYEQLLPLLVGKELASLAAGIPGGSTTTTASGPKTDPLMQGLGLGISGLGALGGGQGIAALLPFIASDRRIKRDIEQIGTLFDGTPVYRFRYLGGVTVQVGLMADEVVPESVRAEGNLKLVNYAIATERAAQLGKERSNGL